MEQLVAILTIHQTDSLVGQLVCPDVYFNPSLDVNQDWFISSEEIDNSIYPRPRIFSISANLKL